MGREVAREQDAAPAPSVAQSTAAISSSSPSDPWSILPSESYPSWSTVSSHGSSSTSSGWTWATAGPDIGNMGDFSEDDAANNANNPWEVIDSILGPLDFHNLATSDQPAAGPHEVDPLARTDQPAAGPHEADQPAADNQPAAQLPTTIEPDQDVAEPPDRPLSSLEIGAIADALRRANMTGSISIQLYANICGVPTTEHIWGPHIAWAMKYLAVRYMQRAKLNNSWYLLNAVGLKWGWWYAPREFKKDNAITPADFTVDRLYYPCVFLKIGDDYYMICIHLLIKLARMWLTHPSRFVEWSW